MHFKEGKMPGVDCITATFIRKTGNRYHISARRGVLSLIRKKGQSTLMIKNWHPLTLLMLDYKILSKALDNRLKGLVLNKIIEPYQTGFMEGWNIFTNTV